MKNVITKKLEKFVSNVENHIFVVRFRAKIDAFNENMFNNTDIVIKTVVTKYRKVYKYTYGKGRVKNFLINNINDFEKDHNYIVCVIENGDVKDNWERYSSCKNRISAILRANRRMNLMKVTDNKTVQSYLNERAHQRILLKKYELST